MCLTSRSSLKRTPKDRREIKTRSSVRKIPLVGVSLLAAQAQRNGFPRYKDNNRSLSKAVNKYFGEHGAFAKFATFTLFN